MLTRLKQISAQIRAFFGAARLDRDLDRELDSHFTMLTESHIHRGMTPEQARRAARLELGGLTQLREAHRETRGLPGIDTLIQDLRYTLRILRRDAGFTIFAILIAGLGIGATSTVFSVVNALLLRPLPFSDPHRLVWISNADKVEEGLSGQTVPVGHFTALRDHNQSFTDIASYYAFYGVGDSKLTGFGDPERLSGVPVSQNFFSVLGVNPMLGRSFNDEECKFKGPRVVMLSYRLWRRRFNSDSSVVGNSITLNDEPVRVVGVMPPGFDFATVFAPGSQIDLYFPFPLTEETNRMGNTSAMIGRLKPGVTVQRAQAELNVLGPVIKRKDPDRNFQPSAALLEDHVSGRVRPALLVLACAVGVVMLIVCANLSNLLLVRTAARQKEMAIRAALGAGRRRLIRQLLTESVVLSCCGAAVGVILAVAATAVVANLNAFNIPLLESVRVDARVLCFTLVIAVVTGLAFGLVPALQTPDSTVHDSLKDSNRGSTLGKRHSWIRNVLVVSEIAFACVLLVGTGLLIRSFLRVLDVDLGFRPEHAAALRVDPGPQYSTQARRNAYYNEALDRVKSIPGVEAAGLTDSLPLGSNRSWSAGAKGRVYSIEQPPPPAFVRIVSDGYLKAMGIGLRAGRDLSEQDTPESKPVILINQTTARLLWPGENPIGQTLMYTDVDREVVGVVDDVKHLALEKASGCEVYIPIRQSNDYASVDLVVRTALPPAGLASSIRAALKPLDPNLPTNEFRTLQQIVDTAVSPRRFAVTLLSGFAGFALILASLGIYGVVSYSVSQRTQEIGIRMALGASARDLQGRIILQTLRLSAIGISLGVAVSWVLSRSISGLLFGVAPTDPATFLGVLVILSLVAAVAGYVPSRRASRIEPTAALRAC